VYCLADCGPGWLPAIIPVLEICEARGIRVVQIKEKFGGLRIYLDDTDDDVHAAILLAESIASRTCEECGAPGELRGPGWYRTRCDDCARPITRGGA
jgi:hypothetical protein